MRKRIIQRSISERIFDTTNTIFILIFSLTILYPFWAQIVQSLTATEGNFALEFRMWPRQFSIRAYLIALSNRLLMRAYLNTIFRTVVGTFGTVIFSGALAYGLSKRYLIGRNIWTFMIIFTMFFGGGLIPTYMLIRALGMLNTLYVYVVPGLVVGAQAFLIRNYMMTIPDAIEESAKIDGANDIYIWIRIVMPASIPILATVALWNAVAHWNAWFDALIYNTDRNLMVAAYFLQKVLRDNLPTIGMSSEDQMQMVARRDEMISPESLKSSILIITILPIIFVYPFLQKYFIKGIIIGSLKG